MASAARYWAGLPQGFAAPATYSAAAGQIVPPSDPGYQLFLASGQIPDPWPRDASGAATTQALDGLLASLGLPASGLANPSKAQLAAYAAAKSQTIRDGGLTVSVASAGVQCSTTGYYLTLLAGAVQRSVLAPSATLNWRQRDGSTVVLDAAATQALGLAVANWVQSVIDAEAAIEAAISAGTIAAFAQIDDPASAGLPSWPQNS